MGRAEIHHWNGSSWNAVSAAYATFKKTKDGRGACKRMVYRTWSYITWSSSLPSWQALQAPGPHLYSAIEAPRFKSS